MTIGNPDSHSVLKGVHNTDTPSTTDSASGFYVSVHTLDH
jgi:hypothetical protein